MKTLIPILLAAVATVVAGCCCDEESSAGGQTTAPQSSKSEPVVLAAVNAAAPAESASLATENSPASADDPKTTPTHKQVRVLKPKHNGQDAWLHTYCLDGTGDIWMSVGSMNARLGQPGKGFKGIQIYDPDGNLKAEYPLSFDATAINFAPDGTLYVAGDGKVAHLSANGEILKETNTPNITNFEQFKDEAIKAAKEQAEQATKQYKTRIDQITKQVDALEKQTTGDAEVRKARIESLKLQRRQFEQILQGMSVRAEIDPEQILKSQMRVTGVAATRKDVFICCSSASGRGYDVWRTNHDLEAGKRIVKGLSGCCGNMDIQASGEDLVTAENSRFQIARYDREGKPISSFGSRDRNAPDGFGSCCNPMNVRCLASGEILAAESSIGNIKRFSNTGEFLGIVGKAKISGGCKHVTLGYDAKRNRHYMMNEDRQHICVLAPIAEAPGLTEDEKLSKEARDGLGRRLVGDWKWTNPSKGDAKPKAADSGARRLILFNVRGSKPTGDSEIEFLANGSFVMKGQQAERFHGLEFQWEPVKQSGNELHFAILQDGVESSTIVAVFDGDDKVKFTGQSYFLPTNLPFERVKTGRATEEGSARPDTKPAALDKKAN